MHGWLISVLPAHFQFVVLDAVLLVLINRVNVGKNLFYLGYVVFIKFVMFLDQSSVVVHILVSKNVCLGLNGENDCE